MLSLREGERDGINCTQLFVVKLIPKLLNIALVRSTGVNVAQSGQLCCAALRPFLQSVQKHASVAGLF